MKRKIVIIPLITVLVIFVGIFLHFWISEKDFKVRDYECCFENGLAFNEPEFSISLKKYNGFDENVVLPSRILLWKVRYIGANIFRDESSKNYWLESVVIPDTVEYITDRTFKECVNLKHVQLGKNTNTIGIKAFLGCTSLEQIEFPDSLTYIDGAAFGRCEALKEITIPDNVQSIDDNAFNECTRLEKVNGGKGLTKVGSNAFEGTQWLLDYPSEYVMLGNVLVAYKGNEKDVYLEDGIIGVSPEAFYDCEIESIHMPETLSYFRLSISKEYINKHGKVKVYFSNSNDIAIMQRNEGLVPIFIFIAPSDSGVIKYAQDNGIEYIIED